MTDLTFVSAIQRNIPSRGFKIDHDEPLRDCVHYCDRLVSSSELCRGTDTHRPHPIFIQSTNITFVLQTVFGTDLFNSDDTAGTVHKFKNTTIAISVSTYVVAFLLVLFVDRKRILPRTYTYVKKLSTQLSEYWEKKKTKDNNEGEGGIFANGVSWTRNFNFKLPGFIGMRRRNANETSEPDIELRP